MNTISTNIDGKVAFVTGSNRGIGKAIVEALLKRGASRVYATARSIESLKSLTDAYGHRVVPVPLDVTDPDQVKEAAKVADDVQVVVSNAGFAGNPDFFNEDQSASRQEFEVNYWGTMNVARALAPVIQSNGGGAFVVISSVGGLVNFPMYPTYSDSKAAVHSMTQGLRLLKKAEGLQVVGVYPGPVDTDMAEEIEFEKATPESVAEAILDGVESGAEEVFPDPWAEGYRIPYKAGPKTLERRTAEMLAGAAE
jgi:NAD(P)-dependent dehydrogenase (short-subunit alcohol dehydrogenase family)